MADQNTMLKQISEISFLLDDLRLFLDTHPLEIKAMELYNQSVQKRKQLLKQYADEFEPLTCDCIDTETNGSAASKTHYPGQKHWTWSDGPLPWDTDGSSFAAMMGGV